MTKPLLITDCDEVLLHMIAHFRDWIGEAHQLDMALNNPHFSGAIQRQGCGTLLPDEQLWPLLDGFFETQMARQTLVPHAAEALARIAHFADIVILTNIGDYCHANRVAQLDRHGINHRVITNQGGKGPAVVKLLDEYQPSVAVFVDDLPTHHRSVDECAEQVWRLHMVAEPELAVHVAPAAQAHARIDNWVEAVEWVEAKLLSGLPAEPLLPKLEGA
jgi:hypothetical protein